MDKNKNRLENISKKLNTYRLQFTRVKAINGHDMENDSEARFILKPRKDLLGTLFQSVETKKRWIYDGSVNKSFPNLNLLGHHGTKGLTLSNIKAFAIANTMNYDWFCILEDDAELDNVSYSKLKTFVENKSNMKYDIVLLDGRHNGFGGTCAILYNKRIIPTLIRDLHPLSNFSIRSTNYGDKTLGNLWDWKLCKYITYVNKNFTTLPCVSSGKFVSTIS
jgi:hypothetical protein